VANIDGPRPLLAALSCLFCYVVYCVNCLVNKLLLLQGNSGEAVMVLLTHLLDHVIFTIVTVCLSVADASF